jgi:hypothetical protein
MPAAQKASRTLNKTDGADDVNIKNKLLVVFKKKNILHCAKKKKSFTILTYYQPLSN